MQRAHSITRLQPRWSGERRELRDFGAPLLSGEWRDPFAGSAMGIRLLVPARWHRTDMIAGAKVVLFSPTDTPRFSLLQLPAA